MKEETHVNNYSINMDKILLLNCLISLSLCVCVTIRAVRLSGVCACLMLLCSLLYLPFHDSTYLLLFICFYQPIYLATYDWLYHFSILYNCLSFFFLFFSQCWYFVYHLLNFHVFFLDSLLVVNFLDFVYLSISFILSCVSFFLFITGSLCFFLSLCVLSSNTFQPT